MSALNPDEPAQETPSSIDTQQLQQQLQQQQLHNQQEILVQQPLQPPNQTSNESGRKGPYTATFLLFADLPGPQFRF
jgi:hypothetical protein